MSIREIESESEYGDLDEGLSKDLSNENVLERNIRNEINDQKSDNNIYFEDILVEPVETGNLRKSKETLDEKSLDEVHNSLQNFKQKHEKHSQLMNDFQNNIEAIQSHQQTIINKQSEYNKKISQIQSDVDFNSEEIDNIKNIQEAIRRNQSEIKNKNHRIVDLLDKNLFLPFAKGLALFSALATIALIFDRSLTAIPFFILFLLFLTSVMLSKSEVSDGS